MDIFLPRMMHQDRRTLRRLSAKPAIHDSRSKSLLLTRRSANRPSATAAIIDDTPLLFDLPAVCRQGDEARLTRFFA
jgi:hypothetical protein